jgi:hypothetical protein
MKKAWMFGMTLLISVAFVTCVFAQSATEKAAKAAPTPEKAAPATAPEKNAEKKPAPKVAMLRYGGDVTAVDKAAKTLTVKGKKGDMTFDMAGVRMMGEPKVGEEVMVQYTEKDGKMVADSVVGMKSPRKGEKKETKPAPAAAPAK